MYINPKIMTTDILAKRAKESRNPKFNGNNPGKTSLDVHGRLAKKSDEK